MDVLKPEVYWIGNRCYRVNPCQGQNFKPCHEEYYPGEEETAPGGNTNAQTRGDGGGLKPYVEPDEFEDDEGGEDKVEVIKEENGFKAVCNIPSTLFPHIIGSKGSVKKRIESETRTRINVPRQNEKGDIVIKGQHEINVRKAYKRLNQIADTGRSRREATHFACFSMTEPSIIQKANEFKESVLDICGSSSSRLDESLFQKPEKLHLTICIMKLLDERERKTAADILSSLENELKALSKGKSLKVHLKELEIMNDDPSQVDVLYAKCIPVGDDSPIQNIANVVARKFERTQFGQQTKGDQVKLHCTLINSRYRNESSNADDMSTQNQSDNNRRRNNGNSFNSRESFDARPILQKFGKFDFGVVNINEIKIATRYTTGTAGFYKCYSSLKL